MKAVCWSRMAKSCSVLAACLGVIFSPVTYAQPLKFGPAVRITSPANHATFYAPVDIPIFAYVRAAEFTVTGVEFFAGTNDLGEGFILGSTNHGPIYPIPQYVLGSPVNALRLMYDLVWTNVPPGSYALTVVARGYNPLLPTDSESRTSAPVNITVLASATNSNPVNLVSLVAADPIAIAGTNASWNWPGLTNAVPAWTNWPPVYSHSFTNWGPKDALFMVRRLGDVSAPLTVTYAIGGTASNGVDYVTLPGTVYFPAAEASALIPVVPIDRGVTNFSQTVILALIPDTNAPPAYSVGYPQTAAALILENWPRPLPFLLSDHSFHLNASGPDGAWFSVQCSGDLLNWSSLSTNQAVQGSIDFIDPGAPACSSRFYRIQPLANSPAD